MVTGVRALRRNRGLATLVGSCGVVLAAQVAAQPGTAIDVADSTMAGEVAPDLIEAVGELDAADQPLAARELLQVAAHSGPAARFASFLSGRLRWRTQAGGSDVRHDGRWECAAGPIGGRGVLRLRAGAAPEVAGGGWLGSGPVRLWAGQLALRHGFGLVAADPARRTSLTADQGLLGAGGGLAVRTASGAAAGVMQAGVESVGHGWRLSSLWMPAARLTTLRAAHAGATREWGILASRDSSSTALSCSGRIVRPSFACTWELGRWRPASGTGSEAVIAGLAWQAARELRLEAQSGLSAGSWPYGAGVLPLAARTGWALRAAWRERGAGACEVLIQGARMSPNGVVVKRRSSRVAEVAWSARPRPGLSLELRARRSSRSESNWSERQPWDPATETNTGTRTAVTGGASWEGGGTRFGAQWRSFTVDGSGGGGTRQLASIACRRELGCGWAAWAESSSAWGDAVDLVRALAPLPGVVVPRHWGHWRAEAMAGAGWVKGPFRGCAAVARREAEPALGASGAVGVVAWEAWLEAGASW
jgi:hypothetical protein